jgi:hypothetical protein
MKAKTNTLQTLFGTKRGVGNLAKFLIDIEAATRKWVPGDVDGERRKMFQQTSKNPRRSREQTRRSRNDHFYSDSEKLWSNQNNLNRNRKRGFIK